MRGYWLDELLASYNDGRRKGFFCLAVNMLDLAYINSIMEQIKSEVTPEAATKEKAATAVRLFQRLADEKGIELDLTWGRFSCHLAISSN